MTRQGELHVARVAFDHGRWSTARDGYLALARSGDLSSHDAVQLGEASWWLGMIEETLRIYEDVHRERLSAGAATDAAMAAIFLGMHEALRGRSSLASGWIAKARRLLADFPTAREVGYLLYLEAQAALGAGDLAAAAALTRRIADVADRYADPTLDAVAHCIEGTVVLRRGDPAAGLSLLDEAMLPVVAGEVDPGWAGNLYCHMMSVCHDVGDLHRSRQWTDAAERWCSGFDAAVTFVGICRVHRIELLREGGDWGRALEQAHLAYDELSHIEVGAAAEAQYQLAEVCRLRDDLASASSAYDRAHELGRDPQPGLALLHLRRGAGEVAARSLDVALAGARDSLARAPLLGAAAEVAIARGDSAAALGFVGDLRALAEAFASPAWRAAAGQWEGAALVVGHRPREAIAPLREALEGWRSLAVPYEQSRVRVDLARVDEALGDHRGARRELDLATRGLAALGARHELRVVASLRHRGSEGLTAREVEVVAAIASGRTNREAAQRLHISERTVARHLANVYTKTGVATRTAAVSWARDRGLL